MSLGTKIKEVLTWSGVSQKELAKRLNISYTTFNAYIRDVHPISIKLLKQIADELGVSLFLLLNEDPLPADHTELTEEERRLLGQYRLLRDEQRELISQSMALFLKQNGVKQ